jgi:predicted RNase H-like nuclease
MRSVLGIDPAWTVHEPSGVALIRQAQASWDCLGLAPSYSQFLALADGEPVDWSSPTVGTEPDVHALLDAAQRLLGGASVDLVTIDMPVATTAIVGRRAADSAISLAFGGRGCAAHSPSPFRPGAISDNLRAAFAEHGYQLATSEVPVGQIPALAEVYPHPALLVLLNAQYRVPYKISRSPRYWPAAFPTERRRKLVEAWQEIRVALDRTISGADLPLPTSGLVDQFGNARLKRYEDALDALVCAWVGTQYLQGLCTYYGDDAAAIWTP